VRVTRPGITLVIGGVRAGKSAKALELAHARCAGGRVLFVATAEALDDEMRARIDVHRRERAADWDTLESPIDVANELRKHLAGPSKYSVVVIDCLTLWVSNVLLSLGGAADAEAVIGRRMRDLLDVLQARVASRDIVGVVIVTNEVGLGVVPPTSLGRRYRDALGRANQLAAGAANEVILMVAGLSLTLKS
jgi:adenosylcobinamide kinase/adenosylcobinamide-phosphate guanylyltransferase